MSRRGKSEGLDDGSGVPNTVDVHVGARIRFRRTLLGMSQTTLGERVGLTFQQIQKYERGANRVSASRLWQFAMVLDVPVSFFFDDLSDHEHRYGEAAQPSSSADRDPMAKRETLELVRAYYRIPDEYKRKRLFELIKAVATAVSETVD